VIPALIRKVEDARISKSPYITVGGDGTATRSFLHVDDCARGLILAAERYDSDYPCNLGNESEISIGELAQLIAAIAGYRGGMKFDTSFPPGQPRRRVNCDRAKMFGFWAEKRLEVGLAETIAWYKQHCAKAQAVVH
jgi:GDP-L-fucose synthase